MSISTEEQRRRLRFHSDCHPIYEPVQRWYRNLQHGHFYNHLHGNVDVEQAKESDENHKHADPFYLS